MPPDTPERVQHRWRTPARILWVVLALGYLILWLASLPDFYERSSTLTVEPFRLAERVIVDNDSIREAAAARGLSLPTNAVYDIAYDLLQVLVYYALAAVILWRTSSGFGWFTAMVLMLMGVVSMTGAVGVAPPFSGAILLVELPGYLVWPFWMLWLYLFPNGRTVPRWTRLPIGAMLAAFLVAQVAFVLALGGVLPARIETFGATWGPVLALPLLGLILFAQIYRYRRVATWVERQQTKWFVITTVTFVMGIVLFVFLRQLFANAVVQDILGVISLAFPASVAIAVLRYRLWDIDIIIRRTLIYGTFTAVLALVYFGSVVFLQQVFRPLLGAENDLAVVVSTLTVAVLFRPVRGRIQAAIDRHFYRRKYDTAKTLQVFSGRLRDEVEIDRLTNDLLVVVEETMQPAHVSLWLRPAGRK